MRLLMPQRSHIRLAGALAEVGSGIEIVTMDEAGHLSYEGRGLDTANTNVDIVWLNRDAGKARLNNPFFTLALRPGTRWLQTSATGLDDARYAQLLQSGVRLSNSDAQAVAIAQYVLAEVLAEWSGLAPLRAQQERRHWERMPFREVSGTTWLIIGYGNIGHEVARRARSFGARILGIRQRPLADDEAAAVGTLDDLPTFLPQADVVLLACTLTQRTRGLVDAAFLGAMRPGAALVNVARGALVNEKDLLEALEARTPGVAILDVFAQEPLPQESPFWAHPRVRLSPHNSANGDHTSQRGDDLFLANLRRFLDGQPLLNEVHTIA